MDAEDLMCKINNDFSEARIAVVITGGGTSAIGEMLRYGGSSSTFLYGHVPYSPIYTERYLGRIPDKLCSAEAARMLAMRAFHDVVEYHGFKDGEIFPIGLGATSALGKITPEREGREHKIYVAVQTREKTTTYTLFLNAPRSRVEEEKINELLILNALAESCNIKSSLPMLTTANEKIDVKCDEGVVLESILCGEAPFSLYRKDEGLVTLKGSVGHVKLLLPASFNPLHDAHRAMAKVASEKMGHTCHFEMSITNANKPPLTYTEIYQRLDHFDKCHQFKNGEGDLWITRLPTFIEKAEHFAPVIFVVGADTAHRICDPRFYGGSESKMLAALQRMTDLGVKFVCFSRIVNGELVNPIKENTPKLFYDMSISIDSKVYASEISSTEIRNG